VSSAVAALLLAGAGPANAGTSAAPTAPQPQGATSGTQACDPLTKFKRSNFDEDESADIDNKFLPLIPGTQFVLTGESNVGGGMQTHTIVHTVTDLVKEINGVTTRVLWDVDIHDGQVVESELAFQAQDERENVWSLGEYPEEFENGVFIGAPSTWIAGVDGAKAGVIVPGKPRKGPPFLQGQSLDIDFFDCGQVFKTSLDNVCVPGQCYDDVLVINEFDPLDPASGIQRKFYAPGVGNVKITAVNDPQGETLSLTSVTRLSIKDRLKADLKALKLEKRAYQIGEVYQETEPVEFQPCGEDSDAQLAHGLRRLQAEITRLHRG
jgi:hypothetical protein